MDTERQTYRRVSIPSLKGVEVVDSARGVRVPGIVNSLLGFVVPKLSVVVAHFQEEGGRGSALRGSRGKRRNGGNGKGKDKSLHLQTRKEENRAHGEPTNATTDKV